MKLASATLRKPVAASDAATSSSKPIGSPHRPDIISSRSRLGVGPGCTSRSATAMAPALMKGLRGTPCSLSSCTSELNGLPEGSRPMRSHSASPSRRMASVSENSLEMLWIENGTARVAGRRLLALAGAQRDAELRRRHARQRRDVAGHRALARRAAGEASAIDVVEQRLEVHGGEARHNAVPFSLQPSP